MSCNCPDSALCERLGRHINGRRWEIWNGVHIEPSLAAEFRRVWESQAANGRVLLTPRRSLLCVHQGQDTGVDVSCPTCESTRLKVFACAEHGRCTIGKVAPGFACCATCPDYQTAGGPCGVVIGSYGWPNLIALQIRLIRHTCGDVPILVSDDCTEGFGLAYSGKYAHLAHVCRLESGVTLWPNPSRIGHTGGDLASFWKGVIWGAATGLRVVAKLSQRCLITVPQWLQDGAADLMASGLPMAGQPCTGAEVFPVRSEAVLFDIGQWNRGDLLAALTPRTLGVSGEAGLWSAFQRLGKPLHPWKLFGTNRYAKSPGVVWHCSDSVQAYQALARQFGVELDQDFHGSGRQVDRDYKHG